MKLKTTVPVTNKGLYNEIGVGELLAIEPLEDGRLRISGAYSKEDGKIVSPISKTYTSEQCQDLYDIIKLNLTPNLHGGLSLWEQIKYAFIIEMAQTFEIETGEITIVND